VVSSLTFAYPVAPNLTPLVKVGLVYDSLAQATSFVNPILGVLWGHKPGRDWRLSLFLGAALPAGTGTHPGALRSANAAAVLARSALDNSMFAVNYFALIPGVSAAYVAHGVTVELEATFFQLYRARNGDVDKDPQRTNFTTGLHVGYFILPWLSLGAELRYQRWLSNPSVLLSSPARDNLTFAAGVRTHFRVWKTLWARPALVYARGLDAPMTDSKYNILQVDLAFPF
jgi:hypothetical protein